MPLRAYIEWSVRRDVDRAASLRIRRQFSPGVSHPRLFFFAYAGGESVRPAIGRHCRGRTGDMRGRPSIYAFSGIIGAHISAKMSRYARLILDIRSQRHHQGAYLRENVEICAADPRYTLPVASSGRISPRKCRDMRGRPSIYAMRGRPSIYAFSGIIRAHISGMRVRGRSRHQNHRRRSVVRRCDPGWCSGSFTPPADPSLRLRLRSG